MIFGETALIVADNLYKDLHTVSPIIALFQKRKISHQRSN